MVTALILAAGEGKRMKSDLPKVLHQVAFRPMINWVLQATAFADRHVVVVGHGAQQVQEALGDSVCYALQREQLGTGHAVMQAKNYLADSDCVLVMTGDTPLITADTIQAAYRYHVSSGNSATVVTAQFENPYGYGRIVRDGSGNVQKIVEQKDTTPEEAAIGEINSGMYCFSGAALTQVLDKLGNDNAQGEYYLTDTVELLLAEGQTVGAFRVQDAAEVAGINDRAQLCQANQAMQRRINHRLMAEGVTILSPETTYIGGDVTVGRDTVILPGTIVKNGTEIGSGCTIGPNAQISNCTIGDGTEVNSSVLLDSTVGRDTHIGPFAYVRPNSKIGNHIKIGDFVEIKNATIDDGTKVSHLTYVGDADVGKKVNFGCGTVLVNYDGKNKHRSVIEDNAFIGCNTNLVSPVTVEEGAFIAAGSTITDDVPEHSLAIARSRQVIKTDWKRK